MASYRVIWAHFGNFWSMTEHGHNIQNEIYHEHCSKNHAGLKQQKKIFLIPRKNYSFKIPKTSAHARHIL